MHLAFLVADNRKLLADALRQAAAHRAEFEARDRRSPWIGLAALGFSVLVLLVALVAGAA